MALKLKAVSRIEEYCDLNITFCHFYPISDLLISLSKEQHGLSKYALSQDGRGRHCPPWAPNTSQLLKDRQGYITGLYGQDVGVTCVSSLPRFRSQYMTLHLSFLLLQQTKSHILQKVQLQDNSRLGPPTATWKRVALDISQYYLNKRKIPVH